MDDNQIVQEITKGVDKLNELFVQAVKNRIKVDAKINDNDATIMTDGSRMTIYHTSLRIKFFKCM